MTYDSIIEALNELVKKQILDTIKEPDINASFHTEMYKNGNVKNYESTLRLKYPRTLIVIKNRDFEKYSASFHEGIRYLKLVFITNFYEKRTSQYYLLMGRVHKKAVLTMSFNDLLKRTYRNETLQKYEPKKYVQSHVTKPTIYDRKYLINEHVKSHKKMKEAVAQKQALLKQDLEEYATKLHMQQINKRIFFESEFPKIKANQSVLNDISRITTEYTAFQKGYLLMNHEKQIESYFDFMIENNNSKPQCYDNLHTSFFVDLDSNAIVLNIEMPDVSLFPSIETLTIIRKRLTCKTTIIDESKKDKGLNSYILSNIRMLFEADHNHKFETLYINLFKMNNKCYGLLKISLKAYKEQMKRNVDPISLLEQLNGKRILYETLDTIILPLQKGGI